MADVPDQVPWLSLPAEISDILRPHLAAVADEVIRTLPRDVPAYARPFEGSFGDGVHRGVQTAFKQFVELPGSDRPGLAPDKRVVYTELGRGEFRAGRELGALLGAYRSGARTTFRAFSRIALDAGVDARDVVLLGEAILAYIEVISGVSAEGYAAEQSARAGERDRLRGIVTEMLRRGEGDEESVRAAAEAAAWELPAQIVAVLVAGTDALSTALGPTALVSQRRSDAIAIVPATTTRAHLARALAGRGAVVGPVRTWRATPESIRLAQVARRATRLAADADPVWVDDLQLDLILAAEPELVADLARRRLAPLDGLRRATRERLAETLYSWLRHGGRRAQISADLSIHEQTVGYRTTQLKDLFGAALEDPDARFELELVLRAGFR